MKLNIDGKQVLKFVSVGVTLIGAGINIIINNNDKKTMEENVTKKVLKALKNK